MRALSIRQPYAELILRGTCGQQIKPIEFRSRPTKRIGERFYIYASQQWAEGKLFLEGCRVKPEIRNPNTCGEQSESSPNDEIRMPKLAVVGDNIEVPTEGPEPWMLELAKMLILKDLPTEVIVGTAVIEKCEKIEDGGLRMEDGVEGSGQSSIIDPQSSLFRWHLTDVERAKRFRKPRGHPQPVWFTPF
jgi:hypothetical protein